MNEIFRCPKRNRAANPARFQRIFSFQDINRRMRKTRPPHPKASYEDDGDRQKKLLLREQVAIWGAIAKLSSILFIFIKAENLLENSWTNFFLLRRSI